MQFPKRVSVALLIATLGFLSMGADGCGGETDSATATAVKKAFTTAGYKLQTEPGGDKEKENQKVYCLYTCLGTEATADRPTVQIHPDGTVSISFKDPKRGQFTATTDDGETSWTQDQIKNLPATGRELVSKTKGEYPNFSVSAGGKVWAVTDFV